MVSTYNIVIKNVQTNEGGEAPEKVRTALLALRLITMMLLVAVLTMHVRSMRVFRWEQSVSGGVLVTYCVAVGGLALCAGTDHCGAKALQAYLCSTGAALLLVNAATIYRRWRNSGELTQVVAELLFALGVPLRRQVMIKVFLSGLAAIALLLDLAFVPIVDLINSQTE
ncbi:unnamed protein product [Chrysodeixis includens]|uniref:Uncharacterized protein n=1 Tax=Chrysodeixis includens TaxID=689277 RepID=A0A9P0BKC7_CHRIL|nr:unnamed protein product [Chrysodeixis includens]